MNTIKMITDWDKVFPLADNIFHKKVSFPTRFGTVLAADYYAPKNTDNGQLLPAVAISGPFGAVKEQSSGLYAMKLAQRGFIAIAFDPSFTGESSGEPRRVASPDINTEDFLAAIDYLFSLDQTDKNRISILGICGWGGLALNAAALDPRIHATVVMTMYDMSKVTQEGYFGSEDSMEQRHQKRLDLAEQRNKDFVAGSYKRAGGVVDPLPEDVPQFVKDYHAYYKTPRGYHIRSGNSNDGWNITGCQSFLNTSLLTFAHEIQSAVLIVHGQEAHSRYFSEYAFQKLVGNNKELLIVPNATHVDLYDNLSMIPFDKIEQFLKTM